MTNHKACLCRDEIAGDMACGPADAGRVATRTAFLKIEMLDTALSLVTPRPTPLVAPVTTVALPWNITVFRVMRPNRANYEKGACTWRAPTSRPAAERG